MKTGEGVEELVSGQVWDQFCDMLRQAGEVIQRPTAPSSTLERAEGYRYLTRLTQMAFRRFIEYGDPRLPYFLPNEPFEKLGIDNPDNVYLWATISGAHRYRITGNRGTVPYIGIGVFAGGFGGDGRTIAHLNHEDLAIGDDGSFELLLGPRRRTKRAVASGSIPMPPPSSCARPSATAAARRERGCASSASTSISRCRR